MWDKLALTMKLLLNLALSFYGWRKRIPETTTESQPETAEKLFLVCYTICPHDHSAEGRSAYHWTTGPKLLMKIKNALYGFSGKSQ